MTVQIVRASITRAELRSIAESQFGDIVKAVVDIRREIMAIGGELHSDEEAALLEDGSSQGDLWDVNLYPGESGESWIEFDSVMNIRPSQGNFSRGVEDPEKRAAILRVVSRLVEG